MAADTEHLPDSEEIEFMREEIFEIAAAAVRFHETNPRTPRIVQAAKAVMVEGMRPADAAAQFDFPRERISEAVGRIRGKWDEICADHGWVTETFSLTPATIALIRSIENEAIEPLLQNAAAKGEQRKQAALKVAETKSSTYTKAKKKSKR